MTHSMMTAMMINILIMSSTVDSFIRPPARADVMFHRIMNIKSETTPDSSADNSAVIDDKGKNIEEMMKLFVTAIDEGRQEDLVKAGLKVTTISARESMDEKLSDPEIIASILGPMASAEEVDLKNDLKNQILLEQQLEIGGEASPGLDLDPSIFAELQAEAKAALETMKKQGSGIAALLDEPKVSKKGFGTKPSDDKKKGDFDDISGLFDRVELRSKVPALTVNSENNEFSAVFGNEKFISSDDFTAEGPPSSSSGSFLEIEEEEDIEENEVEKEVENRLEKEEMSESVGSSSSQNNIDVSDDYIQQNLMRIAKLAENTESVKSIPVVKNSDLYAYGITDGSIEDKKMKKVEPEKVNENKIESEIKIEKIAESEITEIELMQKEKEAQETFTKLLKATMDQQSQLTESSLDTAVVRTTVDAITQGDLVNLDMKALLGEALSTLTEQLGIDMKSELLNNPQSMKDVQGIMATNMAELAKNMEELDKESATLFNRLGSLEADLREETSNFDEKKQYELEELLMSQNTMQEDLKISRAKLAVSTEQLSNMMKNLEEQADFLTALALFSIKSTDKKIAFIVGLALTFKVPFDIAQLWAVRSSDPSDLLTIFTQTALCLTCLSHYGLIKGIINSLNGGQKFVLPPPPTEPEKP